MKPCHVETYVKSLTHSIFGAGARNLRFTLSRGHGTDVSGIGTAASAAVMVFAGMLADVFRVRTLGITVVLLLGLSCLLMAWNPYASLLPVVIFALRFTGQGMTSHVAVVAMARWFVATRGRALAIAGLGFMIGEASLPLIMVWLKTMVDWRMLWVCCAVFCVGAGFILFHLLKLERSPHSGVSDNQSAGMNGRHWTRSEALRNPVFWAMAPAVMSFSGFGTAFWFHQVHFAEIKGFSHLALVSVFPLGTVTLAISSIIFGWLIDKFGAVRLLPFYLIPYVIAFTLHWFAPTLGWTAVAVILMGLAGGGQATLLNACWAEFYGTRNLGAIKASVTALMVLGSAVGPGLSGLLIDAGIGFEVQMLGYAACFAGAACLLLYPVAIWRRSLAVAS